MFIYGSITAMHNHRQEYEWVGLASQELEDLLFLPFVLCSLRMCVANSESRINIGLAKEFPYGNKSCFKSA